MESETAKKIVDKVFQIGESSKHYASVDFSTNKNTFAASVAIHIKDSDGLSAGLEDRRYFQNEASYLIHGEWLDKWKKKMRTEREAN